jgi:regulatory protein RepA
LVQARDGNIESTALADAIVETYHQDPPAVVLFDPLVSFGASEGMVNDNEQGIVTAARRIVRGLDCCVRYVHHTGKANARDGTLDQYSGRNGSALPDGSRMTTVMQRWTPEATLGLTPPPACTPTPGSSITVMARAKLSHAPPDLPLIWIRRTGFGFEHFLPPPPVSAEQNRQAQADQLERYLCSQLEAERRHTQKTLEDLSRDLEMTRQELRAAVAELRVSGRLVDADLPPGERRGQRRTYLHPVAYRAEGGGELGPDEPVPAAPNAQAAKRAATYRDETSAASLPPRPSPYPWQRAEDVRRDSGELATWEENREEDAA